jgi:hypothetical protein
MGPARSTALFSESLANELRQNTESLKKLSYSWGSPEWLEMRKQLMQLKGMKASMTRNQRAVYKTLRATGLQWFF